MNDFLITVLAEDHRRELLAEAHNEALAHEALAGRQPWWHRLFGRTADEPAQRPGSTVNGHMAAGLISAH